MLQAPIFGLTVEDEQRRDSLRARKNNAKSVFSDDTIDKVSRNVVKEQSFTDKNEFNVDYKFDSEVDRINTFIVEYGKKQNEYRVDQSRLNELLTG